MQEVSSPVRGEFLLKRRSAPGKGLGNAAAIDQAWHRQDEALPDCSSGVLPPSD